MFKKIGRGLKKITTAAASLVGIGTGAVVGAGGVVTGDVIVDVVVIIGCFILILVNGRGGVPDWFKNMKSDRSDA